MSKPKYVEATITSLHLPDLEKSLPRGTLNATEPLWLLAFSIYNMNTKLRLSVEFESSYRTVFNWLKLKLK